METEDEVYARLGRYRQRGQTDAIAAYTLERGWHIVSRFDPESRPILRTAPPDSPSSASATA